MTSRRSQQIEHYLRTGEYVDHLDGAAGDFFAAARESTEAYRAALLSAVRERAGQRAAPMPEPELDVITFARRKLAPMVDGLFRSDERATVLSLLEQSIIFLTRDVVERIIRETSWLSTAWNVASVYLDSIEAEPLGEDAPRLVGLSEGIAGYVSLEYFSSTERFADYVVHEAAHVFHNTKRAVVGLPGTRRKEWLLEIEFRKRELFAYGCEAYSRIVELGTGRATRRMLLEELKRLPPPPDERVDPDLYEFALTRAVEARNGWRAILDECAPQRRRVVAASMVHANGPP